MEAQALLRGIKAILHPTVEPSYKVTKLKSEYRPGFIVVASPPSVVERKAFTALTGRRVKDLVNDGLRLALGQPSRPDAPVNILGCLSKELKGRSVSEVMDQLRGSAKGAPGSK